MNSQDCQRLIDDYLAWLRRGLSAKSVGGACELTTPFLDRHNDHIQVYAKADNGKITLTDDGYTLSDLRTSGLELTTRKRRDVLDSILRGFGVRVDHNQLVVDASHRNLSQRMHSLVQAMIAVNDMFVMAQPRVASFFWEDVRQFLDQHEIRYAPRVKLSGKSGFDHAIDFLIPKSRIRPERMVQAINSANKNTIGSLLFLVEDTRDARDTGSEAFAFLNDTDRDVGGDVLEALSTYAVKPAPWSRRDDFASLLAG